MMLFASCLPVEEVSRQESVFVPEEQSQVSVSEEQSQVSEESVQEPINLFVPGESVTDGKLKYDFDPQPAINEFTNIHTFMDTLYSNGKSFSFPPYENVFSDTQYGGNASDYFSFVYIDLETGCTLSYNDSIIYQTCSVIKPSLAVFILKNGHDLSQEITVNSYAGGSGVLTKKDIGKSFSAEYLMEIMITESDNTAYVHLLKKYGQQEFSDYLESIGNKNTNVGSPTWYKFGLISPSDLAVMMKDIHEYALRSENGAWVLELMGRTSYNELITSVGAGVPVSHKYGEDNGIEPSLHDAAIYTGEHPYVLVILSKSDLTESETYDKFRAITLLVNDFHAAMHGGADKLEAVLNYEQESVQ